MPTLFDGESNAAYSIDLQNKFVYKFDDRAIWKVHFQFRV